MSVDRDRSLDADRREMDFQHRKGRGYRDHPTDTVPGVNDAPEDLADSPTVNRPETSPAAAARAAIPDNPGAGWAQDVQDNPLPVRDPDAEAVMTERASQSEPGAPLGRGMGPLPPEDMASALGEETQEPGMPTAADQRMRDSLSTTGQMHNVGGDPVQEHGGVVAGMDETTGTDDPSARQPE